MNYLQGLGLTKMHIAEFAKIWATDAEKKMMFGILFECGILV